MTVALRFARRTRASCAVFRAKMRSAKGKVRQTTGVTQAIGETAMRTIFGSGAAVSASTANCDPDHALIVTRQLLEFPRRYYLTAIAALAFVVIALPNKNVRDVSELE